MMLNLVATSKFVEVLDIMSKIVLLSEPKEAARQQGDQPLVTHMKF